MGKARTAAIARENLVALHMAFDAMFRAGEESLARAYDFGQIADALSHLYTYETMGNEVDRTASTVAKYAKLYRRYSTVEALLQTARKYQTFDVAILIGSSERLASKFGYQCGLCGSWDTHRKPKPEDAVLDKSSHRVPPLPF
jgi:hypothetical protein